MTFEEYHTKRLELIANRDYLGLYNLERSFIKRVEGKNEQQVDFVALVDTRPRNNNKPDSKQ